ncbi:MAG: hypothetical protein COX90_00520 [Candidatus Nealsonbacteria bacterium CG_4_10_14_0_2_um_filter_38_17]|uniref:NYN domain-containing protein n=2 Tax=Candidatus Nealsoniibacteriota TaxID=1817911 RepID=A0A2M7UZ58_9BACT|nr:MAG: hypothetical protein COX36_03390 [Candidatus Nealsonbacteria bacterium CG23_combo_of_CG06-09_8_20_14_all_38_19]PIZ89218.1 MAG: hypothetical protein COX90_00520 [Candidatus Nealsonbacteria bacterium CG_4_10_14_0_2_um_filter_38_17]
MDAAKERRPRKRNKVLVLIDFENLLWNTERTPPERFSIIDGLDRIIKDISREIGPIVGVFVFLRAHLSYDWATYLQKMNFFIILCPPDVTKQKELQDTTDAELIRFGQLMIPQITGLTHLCIGSGDKDFEQLARTAILNGKRIAIIAGNRESLSGELSRLADLANEKLDGNKMIYILSQLADEYYEKSRTHPDVMQQA